ncbi:hypothetical protein GWI34_06500 [Actinomadura sp. DSM 109109]|nr:hypothetical protein [Actinomadura lepetitiana]
MAREFSGQNEPSPDVRALKSTADAISSPDYFPGTGVGPSITPGTANAATPGESVDDLCAILMNVPALLINNSLVCRFPATTGAPRRIQHRDADRRDSALGAGYRQVEIHVYVSTNQHYLNPNGALT